MVIVVCQLPGLHIIFMNILSHSKVLTTILLFTPIMKNCKYVQLNSENKSSFKIRMLVSQDECSLGLHQLENKVLGDFISQS